MVTMSFWKFCPQLWHTATRRSPFPTWTSVRSQPGPTLFFQPFLHHLIASLICLLRPQDVATDPFYGERPKAVCLALHDSPPLDCSSLFVSVIRRESFSFCYASGLCPLLPTIPVFLATLQPGRSHTSVTDAPPACNPAACVRREVDGGIRQADGQDSLREADGVLQAHQGDVRTGALSPGVHGVGPNPGDTHLLGPRARVPQPPGP